MRPLLALALVGWSSFCFGQVVTGPVNPGLTVSDVFNALGVKIAPGTLSYQGVALPGARWQFSGCAATPLLQIPLRQAGFSFDVEALAGLNFTDKSITGGGSFGVAYQRGAWKLSGGLAVLTGGLGGYFGLSWAS